MFNGAEFNRNVSKHTLEDLAPYVEQHVAWSLDGKHVLAHAPDLAELYKELDQMELKDYVIDYIPDPNLSFLGGLG